VVEPAVTRGAKKENFINMYYLIPFMRILDFFRKKDLEAEVTPQICCNVSSETNEWNKLALQLAREEREKYVPEISPEEMRKRQEETYRWNEMALDYARGRA